MDHSSFRSKLLGLYSLLLFLHHADRHSLNTKPTFKLACDGKSVLHRLWKSAPTSPTEPHYDLLLGTRYLLSHCRYQVTLSHVYGHQDTGTPTVLTREAQLNIEADARAKEKLARYVPGPPVYSIPFAFGSCYLGKTRVVKNIIGRLREFINGQPAKSYWKKRRGIPEAVWKTIDWKSVHRAMREIPLPRRRWVSKFISGHFSHGKNMQRWKFRTTAQCPRCHESLEDKKHILKCPAPEAAELWSTSISHLKQWL